MECGFETGSEERWLGEWVSGLPALVGGVVVVLVPMVGMGVLGGLAATAADDALARVPGRVVEELGGLFPRHGGLRAGEGQGGAEAGEEQGQDLEVRGGGEAREGTQGLGGVGADGPALVLQVSEAEGQEGGGVGGQQGAVVRGQRAKGDARRGADLPVRVLRKGGRGRGEIRGAGRVHICQQA